MISKGQQVFLKREWQDPGDDKFTWIAVEDQAGDRVMISPDPFMGANGLVMAIRPIQNVDVRMLELNQPT